MKTKRITVLIIIFALVAILPSCTNNNAPVFDKQIRPLDIAEYEKHYRNIKFGEDGNSILFEVEWHTYETLTEEYIPKMKKEYEEYVQSEEYMHKSELYKKNYNYLAESNIASMERSAKSVKENKLYLSRFINGKEPLELLGALDTNISKLIDSDGYYVWDSIYPYKIIIHYHDENHIFYEAYEALVYTIEEYEYKLKKEVIPLCDELLAKSYITQDQYDMYTLNDPVYRIIVRYIGWAGIDGE